MHIYVVNGAPCAGKTTFENNVKQIVGEKNCEILSTITPIKEIAKMVGWNGQKDLKSRKFLSDLKDLLTEYNDFSFNYISASIAEYVQFWGDYGVAADWVTVFIDCREPEEIKKLCDKLGAKSLLIRRASAENSATSNHADEEVLNYDYDIVIENDGNLIEFANKAFDFVEKENIPKKSKHLTVNLLGEIVEE